jgi:GNAT superfamily N-acetyltransferase
MTALLLEAGANPDDGESLYHATETSDHRCLRLLLDAGARVAGTNALAHALDREDPAMLRLLLDHAPAAAEPWPERDRCLRWAVYRGRSPEVLRLLVEHGAHPGEREGADSAYGLAVAYGRPDLAEALVALGARRDATAMDELLGACARGDALAIVHLAVVASARRRGVGRALVQAAAQREPGARLVVASPTPSSVPFWERLGLRLEAWPPDRRLYLPFAG